MAEHRNAIPNADSEKRSYSVAEAAEILGVSKRSIYKTVRIGKKLRISRKSFDEWLDGDNNI